MDIATAGDANTNVNNLCASLEPITASIVYSYSKDIDAVIDQINKSASLTNEEIRMYMLKLSICSYIFSTNKDTAALKSACAKALLQEKQAVLFNEADGTVNARTNEATIKSSDQQIVNILYSTVTDLMKTKLDEAHRVVKTLSDILISRQADAKLEAGQNQNDTTRVSLQERMN